MKRIITFVALTLIALSIVSAAQPSLRDYLMDAKCQVADVSYPSDIAYIVSSKGQYSSASDNGVSITVYNSDGSVDYTLSGNWSIDLYMSSPALCLCKDSKYRETIGFTLDSWLHEGPYTAARTRDGQTIVIIDWTFVKNDSSRLFSHHV